MMSVSYTHLAAREAAGLDDSGLADDEFQFALFRADFPAAE